MKKIIMSLLVLGSSISFAAGHTDMQKKWNCTTNASSSEVASDKSADEKMSKNQSSLKSAMEFASKHCRDCTKITCEVK